MGLRSCASWPWFGVLGPIVIVSIAACCSTVALAGEVNDAAKFGNAAKVKQLLGEHSEAVESKGEDGRTPLHEAALGGFADVAEVLLASHADVNAKDNRGETPLHWAAKMNRKAVAELLLRHNALVDARSDEGDTPLWVAAINGNRDAAEVLLAHGARVNVMDNRGRTPLDAASGAYRKDLADFLVKHGAHAGVKPFSLPDPAAVAAAKPLLAQADRYFESVASEPPLSPGVSEWLNAHIRLDDWSGASAAIEKLPPSHRQEILGLASEIAAQAGNPMLAAGILRRIAASPTRRRSLRRLPVRWLVIRTSRPPGDGLR